MNKQGVNEIAKYFEDIFNIAHEGIIFVNHKGVILRINPAFTKILGYEEHEVLGKNFYTLAYKDQKTIDLMSKNPLHRFHSSTEFSIEILFLRNDGNKIPVRFRSVIIRDEHAQVTVAIGVIEQMAALAGDDGGESSLVEKMWEAQQNFENVLNNSTDIILMCDISGNVMMANKTFLQLLDYKPEEVSGKHIVEFSAFAEGTYATTTGEEVVIDGEYVQNASQISSELFEKGYVQNWEMYFVRKDTVHVPVETTMSVLKDKDGERRGSVVIARNITERKRSEKKSQGSKDFLENIFRTSADGIMVSDSKGCITMLNKSVEEMSGYSGDELIGKSTAKLGPKGKKYEERVKELIAKLFEDGVVTGFELTWLRKDGVLIDVEVNVVLMQDEEDNITGSIASFRDITERKKIEQKLLQSEKLKSLGELSGGVAHDFNNVLAAILGRVQLLKMQFKPPSGKQEKRKSMLDLIKSLEIIERASLDGAETVRRIQEFSRKRVDDKEFTKIDINELVDNALDFTKVRWKNDADSKGIEITIQKEFSPLPSTQGSASELREVFTNLINNALDAMPQGGSIKIKTFKENNHISIKVEDTGVGISEVIRNRIFDPFFTTKGVQSTGLGMSVSYGIVNRHGGTIRVDSVEGKGATFTISIPVSDNILVEEEKTKPIPEEKRKSTVLVIEDEEEVRNLLADILIQNGHQVETASDGNQGIDIFKKKDFDLVFTDLGMPGTSGWEVAETVKSINERIPVAIITGWNVELKESEMRERGVNLIAYKPFKIDQILRLVQEGMELREQFEAA